MSTSGQQGVGLDERVHRNCPGRPRLVYRAAGEATVGAGHGYRVLASYLAGRPAPLARTRPAAALQRITDLLRGLGPGPEPGGPGTARPRVLLHCCPFSEAASEQQEVVCAVRLGLMRGTLAELRAGVRVRDLLPFAEPNLCVAYLEVPAWPSH